MGFRAPSLPASLIHTHMALSPYQALHTWHTHHAATFLSAATPVIQINEQLSLHPPPADAHHTPSYRERSALIYLFDLFIILFTCTLFEYSNVLLLCTSTPILFRGKWCAFTSQHVFNT